jgi:nuclear transport factor 2 (NTF2) superfamily protein
MNDLLNNSRDFIKIKLLSDEFNSFNPAQIKLALHMISTKKNSVEILQIYDQVKLHSSNILVFNQLLENI